MKAITVPFEKNVYLRTGCDGKDLLPHVKKKIKILRAGRPSPAPAITMKDHRESEQILDVTAPFPCFNSSASWQHRHQNIPSPGCAWAAALQGKNAALEVSTSSFGFVSPHK